jgi:UDP-N-acetylmuramate: L-alanyl-gamma-D-glutamyl-meso-diaminopimelate ligase
VYVVDDYAHHPTAIRETLRGLRKRFSRRRLVAVFEPRSATCRRSTFQNEFVEALSHADAVVVGRLFRPEGIPPEERLDPAKLALELHQNRTPASFIEDVDEVVRHLVDNARPGDVIAVLSSGAFDGLHGKLLAALGDPVRPATPSDMAEIRAIAGQFGLLEAGLDDGAHGNFYVLHNETGFVGCIGLEVFGEAAILRSLAVKPEARGVGYGWLLADTVISVARHRGVRRIYLLTENASDFFANRLGFRVIDIATVTPAIADSVTFREQRDRGVTAMRFDL